MPYNPKDDLHGNVPDQSEACLLIIDMINPFTFDGAKEMLPAASAAAQRIAALKKRLKAMGLPVIYVNDNFGKWRSDYASPAVDILMPYADAMTYADNDSSR